MKTQDYNKSSIDAHEIAYSKADQLLIHMLVMILFQPVGLLSKAPILKMQYYNVLNQNKISKMLYSFDFFCGRKILSTIEIMTSSKLRGT